MIGIQKSEKGNFCPVVICDYCHNPIEDHTRGIYIYRGDRDSFPGLGDEGCAEMYHAHKGNCDAYLCADIDLTQSMTGGLKDLMFFLCRNLNIDHDIDPPVTPM